MKNSSSIVAQPATRPQFLAENRGLPETSPLFPGDRVTAQLCGDLITGTIQLPAPEALAGTELRGAEFAYYRDGVWRVELLGDDGQIICCHSDQCEAVGGAA